MSYILHFKPKNIDHVISIQQIKEYFKTRENYTVNDFQALYSNTATGVYFTFEYGGRKEATEEQARILPAYFNIQHGKPHIYALEAEPELSEFIRTFDLTISDLFMKSSSYGEYNELDFYRGWNSGNEIAYRDLLKNNNKSDLHSLPTAWMEKVWRWNFHVPFMQAEQGKELFIPKILFIDYQSTLFTAVVWTDGQPIALPKVDKLILYRRNLASGFHLGKHEDMALASVTDVEPLLKGYPLEKESLEYYTVIYKEIPQEIKRFVKSQKAVKKEGLKFIGIEEILDKEMLENILKEYP